MEKSFIYVIGDSVSVKIGYSKHPSKRLLELQVGNSCPLVLHSVHEINSIHAPIMEELIHKNLRHLLITGEWYSLSPSEAYSEIEFCFIRYGDTPSRPYF